MSDTLNQIIQRIIAGDATEADVQAIAAAFQSGQLILTTGQGTVGVGGNVAHSSVIPGNENIIGDGNIVINGADAATIEAILRAKNLIRTDGAPTTFPPKKPSKPCVVGLEIFPSVPVWVGRDALMQEIQDTLLGVNPPQAIALIGQGGIGKTSLALKFLENFSPQAQKLKINCPYAQIIAIRVDEYTSFEQVVDSLILKLDVEDFNALHKNESKKNWNPDEKIQQILRGLGQEKCLLLLDNLEAILHDSAHPNAGKAKSPEWGKLLYALANNNHQSPVIFTSRETLLDLVDPRSVDSKPDSKRIKVVKVDGISNKASIELFRQYELKDSEEDLRWVTEQVGGHVFLLIQLANHAKDRPGYLRHNTDLVTKQVSPILRQQLSRHSDTARELLKRMSVFPIPANERTLTFLRLCQPTEKEFQSEATIEINELINLNSDQLATTKILVEQLSRTSLVEKSYDCNTYQDFYYLHRVLIDFLQEEYKAERDTLKRVAAATMRFYFNTVYQALPDGLPREPKKNYSREEVQILQTFVNDIEASRQGEDWLSENKEKVITYITEKILKAFSLSGTSKKHIASFQFSLYQFLEQVSFCLHWGDYSILDSPEIPLILEFNVYDTAFHAIKEYTANAQLPHEVNQEIQSCLNYLIERLPFY